MKFSRKSKDDNEDIENSETEYLSVHIEENLEKMKQVFSYPTNVDFVISELVISFLDKKGALLYLSGMADVNRIENQIIAPLLEGNDDVHHDSALVEVISKVLCTPGSGVVEGFPCVTKHIISGDTILLIDGYMEAIYIPTLSYEHRSVQEGQIERVIKGPKEAFVESSETNRSLIRKYIKSEQLVAEKITIGERSSYVVCMMYLKDLVDPELVNNVRKRVSEIQVDGIIATSQLEQHIEERPYSLVPTVLATERPDRVVSFLYEGHVALLDSTPTCLVVPVTFWSFFHTAEDQYQRWAYANFIRIIRLFAYFTALLTPGLYIGLSDYHAELIPTDLLLSIAAARELVPFPVVFEVFIMEVSFELIREAGARVPTALGTTISIVGALILGQAAVQAGIISPILIIVVAITGLSSFAIPEASINYMTRITRFIFLFCGATMGFLGIGAFMACLAAYLASVKSFGVPFLAPIAPGYKSSGDTILRSPVWKQWVRPFYMKTQGAARMKKPKGRQSQ